MKEDKKTDYMQDRKAFSLFLFKALTPLFVGKSRYITDYFRQLGKKSK